MNEPVRSAGSRSGVNCARVNSMPSACANDRAARVLPSPGSPRAARDRRRGSRPGPAAAPRTCRSPLTTPAGVRRRRARRPPRSSRRSQPSTLWTARRAGRRCSAGAAAGLVAASSVMGDQSARSGPSSSVARPGSSADRSRAPGGAGAWRGRRSARARCRRPPASPGVPRSCVGTSRCGCPRRGRAGRRGADRPGSPSPASERSSARTPAATWRRPAGDQRGVVLDLHG